MKSPSKRGSRTITTGSPKKQKLLVELLPEAGGGSSNVPEAIDHCRPLPISTDHTRVAGPPPIEVEQPPITTSSEVTVADPQDQFLADFRAYLKWWVRESPEGPLDSDLQKVTDYFVELCSSDSASVFIVLRCFRRVTLNTGDADWCTAFNSLLGSVQDWFSSHHNATLPIEPI